MTPGQELVEEGFRVVHHQFPNGSGYSLAYKRHSQLDCIVYYTFRSPKDQFNRKIAHKILLGRYRVKPQKGISFTAPEGYPRLGQTVREEFEALIVAGQLTSASSSVKRAIQLTRVDSRCG